MICQPKTQKAPNMLRGPCDYSAERVDFVRRVWIGVQPAVSRDGLKTPSPTCCQFTTSPGPSVVGRCNSGCVLHKRLNAWDYASKPKHPKPDGWLRGSGHESPYSLMGVGGSVPLRLHHGSGTRVESTMKGKELQDAWKQWKKADPAAFFQAVGMSKTKAKRKLRKIKRDSRKKPANPLLFARGDDFYLSTAWLSLRRRVLDTYGYKCMNCDVVDAEMHVDHIKPRSRFPHLSLKFSNLQVLCRACNMEKSNRHSTDYRPAAIGRELDLMAVRDARARL